ncbi:MAG TPA: methyltransferase domain-containing protein [Terriglobia bacterium]|jgi:SAM-dependent methyltransferase
MADWDERYRKGENIDAAPDPLVTRFGTILPAGRALDLACGPGRHALWLAEHGWDVTAVDSSRAGIEILRKRAEDRGVRVDSVIADLERHEFAIQPASFDLIVVVHYLQRDLFPAIRKGVRLGGAVIAAIAMIDETPLVRPMNPAYLVEPGDLRAYFEGWRLLHDFEGKPPGDPTRRASAEIVAVR